MLYLCDPKKNNTCRKSSCQQYCILTTKKKYRANIFKRIIAVIQANKGRNMAKEWARPFYNGKRWIKCKDGYITERTLIDGGVCEECKEEAGYIVHHRTWLTKENINNPDICLNWDNLEYVCKKCHDNIHGVGRHTDYGLVFDENGQPMVPYEEIERKA